MSLNPIQKKPNEKVDWPGGPSAFFFTGNDADSYHLMVWIAKV